MGHEYEKTVKIALELLKDAEGEVTRETVMDAVVAALMCVGMFIKGTTIDDCFHDIIDEVIRVRS